jgi:hypothetical protein
MLSLKFIANMFSSEALKVTSPSYSPPLAGLSHSFLCLKEVAMRYATKIIQGLVNVALVSTTEKLVRSCIASIVLK